MTELRQLLRPELQDLSAYGAPQIAGPIALNTNESAYELPEAVVQSITTAIAEIAPTLNRYPDRDFWELRQALSGYLEKTAGVALAPAQIWAANGSNEVLQHLVQAFGGSGRTALGVTPSYAMHELICATAGMNWVHAARNPDSFAVNVPAVLEQIAQHKPAIIFLCTPNNPTGTSLAAETITTIYEAAPQAIIVVDEAYIEFARAHNPSALHLLPGRERLVVSRTMSKAFSFAGTRLGYLAAAESLVELLLLVRLPYHLSSLTQAASIAALAHADLLQSMVEELRENCAEISRRAASAGYVVCPTDANFVLIGGIIDAPAAWQVLLDRGILVRDVGIPGHLRITAGTKAETAAVCAALEELAPILRKGS